jgi:hypothetical protein
MARSAKSNQNHNSLQKANHHRPLGPRRAHQPITTRVFRLQIAHAKIGKIDFNVIPQSFEAVHIAL